MDKPGAYVSVLALCFALSSPLWAAKRATASAAPAEPDCGKSFEDLFFEAREVDLVNFNPTPEQVALFKQQRAALQALHAKMNDRYKQRDFLVRRMMLARMLGAPIFVYGPPGSAKSASAKDFTHIERADPSGKPKKDVFALQLNELVADTVLKGYLDDASFSSKLDSELQKLAHGKQVDDPQVREMLEAIKKMMFEKGMAQVSEVEDEIRINNHNTMIEFKDVLLDELDKGNPLVLAALLDILNEKQALYGPVSQESRNELIIATGNKTPYAFIKYFLETGHEETAKALLDRFWFKVFVHNFTTDTLLRRAIRKDGEKRSMDAAASRMMNQRARFGKTKAKRNDFTSDMPDVDLYWLGNFGLRRMELTPEAHQVMETVATEMTLHTAAKELEGASSIKTDDAGREMPRYVASSQGSDRNSTKEADVIKASVWLDLLLLPDDATNGIRTEDLIETMKHKNLIPVDKFSVYRLENLLLTGAVGDVRQVAQTDPSHGPVALSYGTQDIETLKTVARTPAELSHLDDIQEDRTFFSTLYQTQIQQVHDRTKKLAEILARFVKNPMLGVEGIEAILQARTPKVAYVNVEEGGN
jgi:MoxR-like ATPase